MILSGNAFFSESEDSDSDSDEVYLEDFECFFFFWPLAAQDNFEFAEDEDSEEDLLSFSESEKSPKLTIVLCAFFFACLFFLKVCIVILDSLFAVCAPSP